MSKKIFVTRPIPEAGIKILKEFSAEVIVREKDSPITSQELLEAVRGVDAILAILTDPIDQEIMDAAGEQLKVIANYAVGYNNIDVAAAKKRGIVVTNTPGVLTDATADMAWSLLFSTARRICESERYLRDGKWDGWGPMQYIGQDITGKTLGIIGAGRIGTNFALKSQGFNMKVLYTSSNPNMKLEQKLSAKKVELEELLRDSDYVSLHVPLKQNTKHLISQNEFKAMKDSAILINTSRGPVVDEDALVEALTNGEIAGAGLDVYEEEPRIHPDLLKLDNVVLCPHIASATKDTRDEMARIAARNIVAVLSGESPITEV